MAQEQCHDHSTFYFIVLLYGSSLFKTKSLLTYFHRALHLHMFLHAQLYGMAECLSRQFAQQDQGSRLACGLE